MYKQSAAFSALIAVALASSARANDTEAETALGGLTLKRSDAISMDSEDLYISRDLVRVKYRFTNTSDAPVETLVAFPLPDIPPDSEENKSYWSNPSDLKFKTTIDGKPIVFDVVQQAIFKEKDVTARLEALKIPVNYRDEKFDSALKKAPQAERDKLVADGLLRDDGTGGEHYYSAQWSVRTSVTRKQTFPAKQTVSVEHQYAPLAGGSVGGGLSKSQRKTDWFKDEQRKYCIDRDWLASFDKKGTELYGEIWLGYVLKTGANWKGPIGDFRLVVDKGKPDALVSFCADGVKKISPTQFEVRYPNFTPTKDLDILIVEWGKE
ncbi:DUF4424 family protein [Methylocystis parvus]|uniref:DUF4424 family protein n=1 Tax=Methylocystis parvus TaxID=134 RepID=UPI003C725533